MYSLLQIEMNCHCLYPFDGHNTAVHGSMKGLNHNLLSQQYFFVLYFHIIYLLQCCGLMQPYVDGNYCSLLVVIYCAIGKLQLFYYVAK